MSARRTVQPIDPPTFVEILQRRASSQPDRVAYAYLVDGELERQTLTYAELATRAFALAAELHERGAQRERVLLMLPPGLDYVVAFWATLAAGATAVPVYPSRPGRSTRALDAIITDAQARFAIGQTPSTGPGPLVEGLVTIAPGDVDAARGAAWSPPRIRRTDLALIQYTSGSTSTPRGAVMNHAILLDSIAAIHDAVAGTPEDIGVSWLPLYHDMGLFGGILEPMFGGIEVNLMAPLAFLQRPMRWLEAASRLGATTTGGPNFAFDLCVDGSKPEDRAALDLSRLRLAMSGAEPIRPSTVERFSAAFAPAGFRRSAFASAYGLAEAMLVSAGTDLRWTTVDSEELAVHRVRGLEAGRPGARAIASCGRPALGVHVEIVDPQTGARVEDARVGEIWVAGNSVVSSYWGRPAESRRQLRARLAGDDRRYLRTGDLGFIAAGEVHVTGRLKEMLIIRGRNYYPLDLELTVEASHPDLRSSGVAAFGVFTDGEERLGIIAEVRRTSKSDPDTILAAIRKALAEEHELRASRVALVPEGRLPRTSSGKPQRLAALRLLEAGELRAILDWTDAGAPVRPDATDPGSQPAPRAVEPATDSGVPIAAAGVTATPRPTRAAIEAWLIAHLAEQLNVDRDELDTTAPFASFGIGSVEATALAGELATWLERPLSPTLTWEYPTIQRLSEHLASDSGPQIDDFVASPQEPIAIVGVGVRFPGAPTLSAFRDLLRNGRDAIREAPADRLQLDDIYDPNPATPGKLVSKNGGFLEGIDLFDPQFFGISPREAGRMDPQQRLMLEVTEEALEDAAIPPARLAGTATGVFVGIGSFEYTQIQIGEAADRTLIDAYQGTGNAHSIAANRISFLYDLRGPSLALDTACSSSLVAIHLACQSLLNHESDTALAGGVNVILSPDLSIAFSQARMLSPDGHCRSFDAAADGYVRSEGAGMIVLKRLSDARRDGDRVISLIRGTAVNQDGLTSGITAPSGRAQQEVTRMALARAGITADDLGAIEAHGTGTPLGDPIEVNALAEVIGKSGDPERRVWLGSVKANVGHLEMASGMAGIAKAILQLSYGEIYPQVNFHQLNPHIRMEGTPLAIPTALEKWPMGPRPRYIGVSSFGFGGTNAHIVLEESREAIEPRSHIERPVHLLTLSAKTETALRELARATAEHLAEGPALPIEDVAYTANVGRSRHLHRLAVIADSSGQMRERLGRVAEGRTGPGIAIGRRATHVPSVAFLFTGQGAQYAGMGRLLYDTQPTFRAALDRCAALLDADLDRPLLSLLFPETGEPDLLAETVYTQPALFALEYALAELWRSWGVVPDVVLGHSVGEYVAACVAGAFSLEDALRLIAARGRLMHGLPRDGAMAAVLAPLERVEQALAEEPEVTVSGVNGPENITISGRRDAVERVVDALKHGGVNVVPLNVSHAFHSQLMDPILDEFEAVAASVVARPLQIALATNFDGQLLAPGATLSPRYWRDHARHAVRFADDLRVAHEYGAEIFLEVGPSPTLTGMGRRMLSGSSGIKWAASLKPGENDWAAILSAAATLFAAGRDIDWKGFDGDYRRRLVTLPTYPFERSRQWFQPADTTATIHRGIATTDRGHPLVRTVVGSPLSAVQAKLAPDSPPWLGDHRVQGAAVVPAAMLIELLLSAADSGNGPRALEDVEFTRALFIDDGEHLVQAVVTAAGMTGERIEVYSRAARDAPDAWSLNASGRPVSAGRADAGATGPEDLAALQARFAEAIPIADFYRLLAERGLEYGPAFRGVRELWRGDGQALGVIEAPPEAGTDIGQWLFHPAVLDAALQVFAAALPGDGSASGTYLPVGLGRFEVHRPATGRLWVHARLAAGFEGAVMVRQGDLRILDETGAPVADLVGLRAQQIEPEARRGGAPERIEDWLYEVEWVPLAATLDDAPPAARESWVVLGDSELATNLRDRFRAAGDLADVAPDAAAVKEDGSSSMPSIGWTEPQIRGLLAGAGAPTAIACLWPLDAIAPLWQEHVAHDDPIGSPGSSRRSSNGTGARNGAGHANGNGSKPAADRPATMAIRGRPAVATAVAPELNPTDGLTDAALAVLHLIRVVAASGSDHPPRIVIVTRAGESGLPGGDESGLSQAAVLGLVRSARLEHPELRLSVVDLEADGDLLVSVDQLTAVIGDRRSEPEVALRSAGPLGRRLARRGTVAARGAVASASDAMSSDDGPGSINDTSAGAIGGSATAANNGAEVGTRLAIPAQPYRLEPMAPGVLDSLELRPAPRRAPGPGEVELEVQAAGVNFRDVMKALGIYPQAPGDVLWLGDEAAGRVVGVGEDVDLAVGQAVFGVAPAAFGSYATTRADYILPTPLGLEAEDAATLPIAFTTALYALERLAHLQAGERVLIHAAAGGVGQAAIQIAHATGAEVFATASEGKHAYLRSLGVEHVFDSRSLAFADGIRTATGGAGVDVVLNSLAGEFIPASIGVLAPYGRFVEIGKRDIFANARIGLWPFRNNLSFFAVDMDRVFRDRPAVARQLLRDVQAGFNDGIYRPLPRTTFGMGSAVAAFRYLAQARNIGKVVLTVGPAADRERTDVGPNVAIRADATYLVTGGTRGLGGRVAESLATLGARHLVLVGRDTSSPAARETARRVAAAGAEPTMLAVDLERPEAVAAMLATIRATLPPLRGIVHAAGVLADASILNLDDARFRSVFHAKATAGLLLHRATRGTDLDFFVNFSSIASVLGNAGQANYAAANAVLDRLAWLRHSNGLAGQTINWGPWSEIGMSATAEGQRIFGFGIGQIAPDRGMAALALLMAEPEAESLVLPIDWSRFLSLVPGAITDPFLTLMRQETLAADDGAGAVRGGSLAMLLEAPPEERQSLLETFVRTELATVLQLEPHDLPLDQPLNTVGLDSLMALELKNRVESSLAITLPIVSLIQGPTIVQLAEDLLVRIEAKAQVEDGGGASADGGSPSPEPDPMSGAEVDLLLGQSSPSPRF